VTLKIKQKGKEARNLIRHRLVKRMGQKEAKVGISNARIS